MDPVTTSLAPAHGSLSMADLFLAADPVVKLVMILLAAASVWCWAIIFEKIWRLRRVEKQAARFEAEFFSGQSLEELFDRDGKKPRAALPLIFAAGMREWRQGSKQAAASGLLRAGLQQRIERAMANTIQREMVRLERSMTVLATVGSAAPFVGLFGTVWGIMRSFFAIAESQNTNLAVVAPGIAEALFATALGLVAAIPATVAYNAFSTRLARLADRFETFAGELSNILSRHMEQAGR